MGKDSKAAARDELLRQLEAENNKLQLLQSEHDNQSDAVQQLNLEMEALQQAIEQKHPKQIETSKLKDDKKWCRGQTKRGFGHRQLNGIITKDRAGTLPTDISSVEESFEVLSAPLKVKLLHAELTNRAKSHTAEHSI